MNYDYFKIIQLNTINQLSKPGGAAAAAAASSG
jgi:hypothetical protein